MLHRRDRAFGLAKLLLGAGGIFLFLRYLHAPRLSILILALVATFAVLVVLHERVIQAMRKTSALIDFFQRGIARLEDRWAGTGENGAHYMQDSHPYARDLDLFGTGSMFELLCTFRTRAGQDQLARWLLEPAAPDEVKSRQDAVMDLQQRIEFREKLFTAGNNVQCGVRPKLFAEWAEQKFFSHSNRTACIALFFASLWLASLACSITLHSYLPITAVRLKVEQNQLVGVVS
jgi:hypothetical protein